MGGLRRRLEKILKDGYGYVLVCKAENCALCL